MAGETAEERLTLAPPAPMHMFVGQAMFDPMKRRPKPPSARTARRTLERASEKLTADRIRLAQLEPGGTPADPIVVESASIIEPRAESFPCLRCGGDVRTADHLAETRDGRPLRAAHTACKHCGLRRVVWFEVAPPRAN